MVQVAGSDVDVHGYLCPTAAVDPRDIGLRDAKRLTVVGDIVRLVGGDAVRGQGGVGRV